MHSVVLDLIWNIATFQSPGPWFWNPPDTPGAYPLLTGLESKDLTSTLGETFGPVAVGKSASLTAAASFPPHDSESQHFLRILNAPDHDLEYPMYLHQMMKDIEKSSHHVTSTISQPSNELTPHTTHSANLTSAQAEFCAPKDTSETCFFTRLRPENMSQKEVSHIWVSHICQILPEKREPQILAFVCGEQSIGFFLNAWGTNAAKEH